MDRFRGNPRVQLRTLLFFCWFLVIKGIGGGEAVDISNHNSNNNHDNLSSDQDTHANKPKSKHGQGKKEYYSVKRKKENVGKKKEYSFGKEVYLGAKEHKTTKERKGKASKDGSRAPAPVRKPTFPPVASPSNTPTRSVPVDTSDPVTASPVATTETPTGSFPPVMTSAPISNFACPYDPMIYASVGGQNNMGLFYMYQYCQGSYIGPLNSSAVEIVVDPTTNRAFAQLGRDSFVMFEFDLTTGLEIEGTRFSTASVNQFHALEFVNGVLYGGGWQQLGTSAWDDSALYRIDPYRGIITRIGPTGGRPLTGLAWTGTTLYGTSGAGWPPSNLYALNTTTGQATLVCEDMTQGFGSLVFYEPEGVLYGGTPDGNVARIDPDTCTIYSIDTVLGWSAGFRPVTGLTMACPPSDIVP